MSRDLALNLDFAVSTYAFERAEDQGAITVNQPQVLRGGRKGLSVVASEMCGVHAYPALARRHVGIRREPERGVVCKRTV